MKAVRVEHFGGPEALKLIDMPAPIAGAGQAVIGVEAAAVGLVDTYARSGAYPIHEEPGFVLGGEVAGSILSVGEGVSESWLGERVYSLVRVGGYAEQVVAEEASLVSIPSGVSAVDAVALGANALVGEFCLRRGRYSAGRRVLVRGASGGIGVATIQLALMKGALVTAVTSSPDRMARLSAIGVAQVLERSEMTNVTDEFDIIIDPVGGPEIGAYMAHLAVNGCYVICGAAGGRPNADFGMGIIIGGGKSLTLSLQSLDSVPVLELNSAAADLFERVAELTLKPVVDTIYNLADAQLAHERLEKGNVFGRLVLTP